MYQLCLTFLYFTVYSVIGWICETIWCSVFISHRFVNRGFLNGPVCPIYGFGALLVIYWLQNFADDLLVVFLVGIVLTSLLEYVTSFILEKWFNLKLWDYSKEFCNVNGRICLLNSFMFGIMAVALMWFIHPFFGSVFSSISSSALICISITIGVLMLTDFIITVYTMLQLKGNLEQIQKVLDELHEKNQLYTKQLQQNLENKVEQYKLQQEQHLASAKARIVELTEKVNELLIPNKKLQNRIMKAFPNMTSKKHFDSIEHLKKSIANRKK